MNALHGCSPHWLRAMEGRGNYQRGAVFPEGVIHAGITTHGGRAEKKKRKRKKIVYTPNILCKWPSLRAELYVMVILRRVVRTSEPASISV